MVRLSILFATAATVAGRAHPDHCTAFVLGRKATVDGASLVGQTADAEGGPGYSIEYTPAADHAAGSMRPVHDEVTGEKIGEIPQVNHTYGYTSLCYGVMNEHKLAFAESTCSGRFWAASLAHNGTALFSNKALSQIALERCKTARCAIKLMGDLAENHGGFYGEDVAVDSGSEALVLADTTEAWVFHIMADPTGLSAIWAAQRVPDEEVAVVPNTFVIRKMLDTDDYMLSSNAHALAKKYGLWDGSGDFDFAASFSLGEYANPHYSGRRIWRAYDLFAPSLHLDGSAEITPNHTSYPFSVKPDELLTAADVFRVYRDYYEGTSYSLVKDEVAAGPFNSPLRVAAGAAEAAFPTGAWERPISIYRATYGLLSSTQSNGNAVVWYAPHTPHASIFAPAWTQCSTSIHRSYAVDRKKKVDRQSLFWAALAVSNWAFGSNFNRAIADVRVKQAELETTLSHPLAKELVTRPCEDHDSLIAANAEKVHAGWWDLFDDLMGTYNDGYVIKHTDQAPYYTSTAVGYPSWWLEAAKFSNGVQAPSSSFENLKNRMAEAEKLMTAINGARKPGHPSQLAESQSSVEMLV